MASAAQHDSKTKLLDAALQVIRAKGYAATTVEDICSQAGVTKGSFFHHFKSKDDLALSATAHWEAMTEGFFSAAPYHEPSDPLDRYKLIEYGFGDRAGVVEFVPAANGVTVRVTFDAETTHPEEQQRQGWQAILNNFAKHVVAKDRAAK